MDLRFFVECFGRVIERKRTLIVFSVLFFGGIVLGLCFAHTPAVYPYHLSYCEKFVERICFTERNIFWIFLERFFGALLLLALFLLAGIHIAALILPPAILVYRAYMLGGSIIIFFSVYRVTGVLIVLALYLPVHLLLDAVFLAATTLSCARAPHFCFCRNDFCGIGYDFLALTVLVAGILIFESFLLLAIFHPIGAAL